MSVLRTLFLQQKKKAEHEISLIEGPLFHRQDIGTKPLIRQRIEQMLRIRAL